MKGSSKTDKEKVTHSERRPTGNRVKGETERQTSLQMWLWRCGTLEEVSNKNKSGLGKERLFFERRMAKEERGRCCDEGPRKLQKEGRLTHKVCQESRVRQQGFSPWRGVRGAPLISLPHTWIFQEENVLRSRKGLSAGSGWEQAKVRVLEEGEELNQLG